MGASEGAWETAANWSAGHVPSSTDVACVGSGKTVTITGGTNQAGVLQGKGGIAISGGSLEVVNSLEVSAIGTLAVEGGAFTGAAEVDITNSFSGGSYGYLKGSGSLVIESGATGDVTSTGGYGLYLEERTLSNAGTFTVGKGSGLAGLKHAHFLNTGTLIVNGEDVGEGHGLIAFQEEGAVAASLTNTGTIEKNEGAGTSPIGFSVVNEAAVVDSSGKLEFSGGGTPGAHSVGSWVASGSGTGLVFNSDFSMALGSGVSMSGSIEVTAGTVTASELEGAAASVTITGGGERAAWLELDGASASTLQNLTLNNALANGEGGRLTGSAEVDITGSFKGGGYGYLAGSGSLVIEPGATGTVTSTGGYGLYLAKRTLINEGTLTVGEESGLAGFEQAQLLNIGTLIVNGTTGGTGHGLIAWVKEGELSATLTNLGVLKKTEGEWATPIDFGLENYGSIREEVGSFEITAPLLVGSEGWGGEENPSAPNEEPAMCEESVSCTGNFAPSETDFAVGGRGVGLDLTRTYNSQAAAAGTHGIFGYGWSSSFSDHLVLESSKHLATLVQADGSTVAFTEGSGGAFTAPVWTQNTLSGSSGSGYMLTLEDQTVYRFAGSTGRLESVTDRNGNATTLAYNGSGNLETITDPDGRTIKLAYNGEGLVESATDPMKHVVKYTYEGGNLATVSQPGGTALRWQFKYDGYHEITEMVDGRGGKTMMKYNSSHEETEQVDPLSRVTTFEYEPFHTKTTNHSTGAVTMTYLNSDAEPASITKGYGTTSATTESFAYNTAGEKVSVTDGDGHTTKYTYEDGNKTSMVDPDGHETKWTYDSTHDIHTMTVPDGETETIERSSDGDPETISRPAPASTTQVTKYGYDAHGDETSMEDPLKRVWKYEYDGAGDRTAEIDPEGDKRTWGYNEDSQETSMVSPRGHVTGAKEASFKTSTERDAQGRAVKVTDPLGHETKYVYDGDGNLETKTDPEGNITTYIYDADNEQTKVKEGDGAVTETGYDGAGQVTSQTDGNKHTTTYVRNVLEEVTEVIDPLGRKTLKEYDDAGNLTSVTDAQKRTTTYKYDPDHRLTEVTYSDGKTPTVKYEYNGDGDRTKMVDGTGTTTYEYDELDRLTAAKDGHGNTLGYEYDLASEQTKITYPNGKAVARAYDSAGRLKSVTDWLEHTTKFAYDADSDQTATTFPSGTSDEDTYAYEDDDAMSEVKMSKASETLASIVYTRNKDSDVTKATSKGLPGEEKPAFTYDANSRLTKGIGIAYKYDEANNPTTVGSDIYAYNAADELEKSEASKKTVNAYTYNEVGERTKTIPATGAATTYEYNQAGDLTAVTRPKEGSTPAIEDTYAYNGDGLRTSQTISGTTTYIAWDTAEQLSLILNDGTNSYIYGPGDLPVEQINNSTNTILYLHHDQQGSTRLLTGSTGKTEATYTYDAYGNSLGTTGTAKTPLGYDGQYTNADTGLIYLRAREYDPATGQFLSVDPKAEETNAVYEYAKDNPLANSDPTGEGPEESRIAHEILSLESEGLKQLKRKHASSETIEFFQEIIKVHFFFEVAFAEGNGTLQRSGEQELHRIEKQLVGKFAPFASQEISLPALIKALRQIYHISVAVRLGARG
jgi:RHS repeat-associated protein